ncbi:hypothetical protein BgiBS90_011718 [Biomphalaria glabrata]|nr:hypothetical protein BgiBS90_011718 [Biomphalaria glabrata]
MTSRSQSDKTSNDFLQMLQNITNDFDALSQLFLQVPVTDLDSGLTFKNISIYLCNKRSVKSLLFWNVHMDLFDFKNHKALNRNFLTKVRFDFFPPRVEQADKILQCSEDMRLHYNTAPSKNYDKLLQLKYLGKKGIHSYCSLCRNDVLTEEDEIEPYYRIQSLYPLVASFTIKPNKLLLEIELIHYSLTNIRWSTIHCSNSNTGDKMDSLCEINMCKENFWKTEEGECKYVHLLKLAVLEEEELFSRTFLNQLSYYVQCYLSTYAGYDIINKWNVSKLYYNLHFERLFYVTELIVLTNRAIFIEENQEDEIVHFTHFAKLTRSLKSIRAKMTPKDLQQQPDRDKLEFLTLVDTQNKYLHANPVIISTINTLNTTNKVLPVCAHLFPILADENNFSDLQPLCIYVSKGDNDADVNNIDTNICLNILSFSGHRQNELSQICSILLLMSAFISWQT